MTICFISDHPFSEANGVFYSGGGVPAEMLCRYVRNNSRLIVVGRKSSKQNSTISSIPNSEFHLLDNYRGPQDVLLRRSALEKELKDCINDADGVIMRFPSHLSLFAQRLCKEMKKPILIEVCGSAYNSFSFYGSLAGKLAAPISEWMHKRGVKKSDFVLYVTQYYLQKHYPAKHDSITLACSDVILPNTITDAILKDRIKKIETQERQRFVIGHIGNVEVSYKGYSVVLNALAKLNSKGYHVEYEIVGGGNSATVLEQAKKLGVENQVFFKGKLDHNQIPLFMQNIDIYVHPSFLEGLPRSVVEAISNAVPCVVSDVGGMSELVSAEWIHHAGDSEKLASDIQRLIDNPDQMIKVAKENFSHAKNYYPEVLITKRTDFYDKFFKYILE